MYSLEHFRKQIHDIARPYHWKVEWANGGDGGKGMTPKTKQLSQAAIRTSAIPGLTINEVAVSYFGMTYKLAGTPTYEPLTAQFIIDSDYKVMTEWRNVLKGVFDYEKGDSGGPKWCTPSVYMGTMKIIPLGTKKAGCEIREELPAYTLHLAYLSGISAVQYGHETKDTPLTFDATITYSYYLMDQQ